MKAYGICAPRSNRLWTNKVLTHIKVCNFKGSDIYLVTTLCQVLCLALYLDHLTESS